MAEDRVRTRRVSLCVAQEFASVFAASHGAHSIGFPQPNTLAAHMVTAMRGALNRFGLTGCVSYVVVFVFLGCCMFCFLDGQLMVRDAEDGGGAVAFAVDRGRQ